MQTAPLTPEQHKREIDIELGYAIYRSHYMRENWRSFVQGTIWALARPHSFHFFVNRGRVLAARKPICSEHDPVRRRIVESLERAYAAEAAMKKLRGVA